MTVYGRVATGRAFALKLVALALVLWLVLALQAAWAEGMTQAQALDAGKLLGSSGASVALPSVDANTLPGFTTASPPETAYSSAGMGLEDTARSHLLVADPNTAAGATFSSITTRPAFSLDREDPLVKHTDSLIADAENNPGTGTGTACKTLTVKDPPVAGTDTCMEYLKVADNTCKRSLGVACAGGGSQASCDANVTLLPLQGELVTQWKEGNTQIIRITPHWGAWWTGGQWQIIDPSKVKSIKVHYNNSNFYNWMSFSSNPSWYNVAVSHTYGSDITELVKTCPFMVAWVLFVGYAEFAIEQDCGCPEWQDTWTDGCGAYASNTACEFKGSACTDSSNPRVIEGQNITRPCWEYTDTYQCYNDTGNKGEDDYCAELRAAGCTQSSSTCSDSLYGRCVAWEQTYQCSVPGKTHTEEDCSSANYCQDGNCFDGSYEANTDFGLAASNLSAAEAMAKDMDSGGFNIFGGQGLTCKQLPLGLKNCCKNSGWGLSIKIVGCSEGEKILAQKQAAGLCHYVGDYKVGKIFKDKYKSFCCFNSKLARIIHEQGRPYIPLGWGDPKNPICRGFTPEELEKIDFGKLDFSEFFADALANADKAIKPGSGDLGNLIKDKVIRLLPK